MTFEISHRSDCARAGWCPRGRCRCRAELRHYRTSGGPKTPRGDLDWPPELKGGTCDWTPFGLAQSLMPEIISALKRKAPTMSRHELSNIIQTSGSQSRQFYWLADLHQQQLCIGACASLRYVSPDFGYLNSGGHAASHMALSPRDALPRRVLYSSELDRPRQRPSPE